jgi:hypothetical protein
LLATIIFQFLDPRLPIQNRATSEILEVIPKPLKMPFRGLIMLKIRVLG